MENNAYFEMKLIISELMDDLETNGIADEQTLQSICNNLEYVFNLIGIDTYCNSIRNELITYIAKCYSMQCLSKLKHDHYADIINRFYSRHYTIVQSFSELAECYNKLFTGKSLDQGDGIFTKFSVETIMALVASPQLIKDYLNGNELRYTIVTTLLDIHDDIIFDRPSKRAWIDKLLSLSNDAGYIQPEDIKTTKDLVLSATTNIVESILKIFKIDINEVEETHEFSEVGDSI